MTATWGLVCPQCGQRDLVETELSGRGKVATFTVQNVPSDEFLNEVPYAYVVVDLEEGGRLTGWISGVHGAEALEVGDAVHWVESYKPGVHWEKGEGAPTIGTGGDR